MKMDMKGSYLSTLNGIITEVSSPLLHLIGFDEKDLIGKPIAQVFLKDLRASAHHCDFTLMINSIDCYIFTKNLDVREVVISVQKESDPSKKLYFVIEKPNSRLDTKFLLAEQLRQDNIVGLVIYSVPDFIILKANQAFFDYVEEPNDKAENVIGYRLVDIILDPATNLEYTKKIQAEIIANKKTMFHHEIKGLTEKNLDRYWDEIWSTVEEDGVLKYIVSIVIDVSERVRNRRIVQEQNDKILQQQMELLSMEQKVSADLLRTVEIKNEFMAMITHELKTPIAVIDLAVQSLQTSIESGLSSKTRTYLEYIKQNNLRQLRLVNNLLDITSCNSGHIKLNLKNSDIVSLTKSITESVMIFTEQKDIQLTFKTRISSLIIGIDIEKYERIMLNLLSNALKFTDQGKSICVSLARKRGLVCIDVRDEGIGIPKEKHSLIFERFGQVDSSLSRQAEGTGIGLALVKNFVEALNGSISVKSKPGMGSTFRLLLPTAKTTDNSRYLIHDGVDINDRLANEVMIEFAETLK